MMTVLRGFMLLGDSKNGASGRNAGRVSADPIGIDVVSDTNTVEAEWRAAERDWPVSVYQTFDWVDCWIETAALRQKIEPAIVILRSQERPIAILPLGVERGPLRMARFLGGEHANIRMPLFDPAWSSVIDREAEAILLKRIAASMPGIDGLDFDAMPTHWKGARVPFSDHAAARPAKTDVGTMALDRDFKAVLAAHRGAKKTKKHRWQVNALAPVGGYRLVRAGSEAEAKALLGQYLEQKAAWFRRQGIADSFAAPGVAAFFHALIERRWRSGVGTIELDAVEFDGAVHAILGSGTAQGRLSGYFLSVADDAWRRVSPGELLIYDVISASCERGVEAFDLGRGDERYKTSWLDQKEPHVRLLLPHSAKGSIGIRLIRAYDSIERRLRSDQRLWRIAKAIRRLRGNGGSTSSDDE